MQLRRTPTFRLKLISFCLVFSFYFAFGGYVRRHFFVCTFLIHSQHINWPLNGKVNMKRMVGKIVQYWLKYLQQIDMFMKRLLPFQIKMAILCDFFLSHILFCNRCTLNDCSTQWHSMCLNAEKMYLFRIVINWIVVVVGNIQLLERFEMFVLFVLLGGKMANEAMILRSKWTKSETDTNMRKKLLRM